MIRRTSRALRMAGVVAAAALLVSGCGTAAHEHGVVSGVTTSDHDGYHGVLLPKPYDVPDLSLTADTGKPFSMLKDTRGRLSLVFFGYTNCPDICQVVMGSIASAYARLDTAQKAKVQVLFVTTDPARDTEQVLRTYLDRLNPAFIGLTGPISQIDAVGKPFGVFVKKGQKLPSGGYEVDHTTSIIAVGPDDTAPLVWNATTSPSELAADITKLLKKKV